METFSALLALCVGNSPASGEFPTQRPVTRSFDVFFDLRLNKRLSNQSWGWWFETLSSPLWRNCNVSVLGQGTSRWFLLRSSRSVCRTWQWLQKVSGHLAALQLFIKHNTLTVCISDTLSSERLRCNWFVEVLRSSLSISFKSLFCKVCDLLRCLSAQCPYTSMP